MRAAILVAIVLLVAGCIGEKPGTQLTGSGGPATSASPSLNTTEGVLLNAPHLKILGPATVQWDLQNATPENPEFGSTLVYFGVDAPSDNHARDDGIAFAAFIPLSAMDGLNACAPTPPSVKHFLRNFGGGGDEDEVGNLTGEYAKGWYHFVAVATEPASIAISFDTEKELRPRRLPGPDPFVANAQWVEETGQREYHVAVESQGLPWFAWAQHQIGVNGGFGGGGGGGGSSLTQVDGGRSHDLSFNDECAKTSRSNTSPVVQTQNEDHRLRTQAAGTGSATLDAVYAPQQAAAAPTTTLHVVAFGIRPVEVPSAPPPVSTS